MTIYESFGRLTEERLMEHEAHLKTLALLRDIKEGRRSIDDVCMTDNGWSTVAADARRTAEKNGEIPLRVSIAEPPGV
jgi:hypothetical protein